MYLSVVAIILLLMASAFTCGTEAAMSAMSRARLHLLLSDEGRRARLARRLLERKERLIGSLLLGNNLFNVLATVLAAYVLIGTFGVIGIGYATLIMTTLIVIFGEVLPRTYALRHPERITLANALGAKLIVTILAPIAYGVQWIINRLLRLFGVPAEPELWTSVEVLRGTIELHAEQGAMEKQERDMLDGILDLANVAVREVMTHRRSVESINASQPLDQVLQQVVVSPFSRFPVWRGDTETIIGVLHAKDLLAAIQKHGGDLARVQLGELLHRPWFVPDTTSLRRQLVAFRQRRQHLALVVDEYGDLEGIVTLEDIIEEIVGEIEDETDIEPEGIMPQEDGSYLVSGWITVRDLNRAFDWKLPDEEAATIAGLVIHEAERIPEVGQSFAFHGFRFDIVRRQRNQIVLLRVVPPERQPPAEG